MSETDDRLSNYHAEYKADKRTIPRLIADALRDLKSDEAATAVGVLHYFRDSAEVFVAGQELCVSKDSRERELGAWILGQLGWEKRLFLDESVTLLIAMLNDREDDVIAGAAVALGFRGDPRAVGPLVAQSTHWNSEVRRYVAWGLGSLSTPESIACLIGLSRDDSAQVRDYATFGLRLTASDTPAIRQAFVERLDDEDAEVRGEAMMGLADYKDPRAIPAIRAALELIELEGFWAIEAAELSGDSSLYDDLVKFREAIDDEDREECGPALDRAIEACRPKA